MVVIWAYYAGFLLFPIVRKRITVRIALAVHETMALSQTPLSFITGAMIVSDAMGKTRVPKSETVMDLAGCSRAVK